MRRPATWEWRVRGSCLWCSFWGCTVSVCRWRSCPWHSSCGCHHHESVSHSVVWDRSLSVYSGSRPAEVYVPFTLAYSRSGVFLSLVWGFHVLGDTAGGQLLSFSKVNSNTCVLVGLRCHLSPEIDRKIRGEFSEKDSSQENRIAWMKIGWGARKAGRNLTSRPTLDTLP